MKVIKLISFKEHLRLKRTERTINLNNIYIHSIYLSLVDLWAIRKFCKSHFNCNQILISINLIYIYATFIVRTPHLKSADCRRILSPCRLARHLDILQSHLVNYCLVKGTQEHIELTRL